LQWFSECFTFKANENFIYLSVVPQFNPLILKDIEKSISVSCNRRQAPSRTYLQQVEEKYPQVEPWLDKYEILGGNSF
jgi:hypothetical protein